MPSLNWLAGNGAQAVQLLESARKYEVYGDFWPQYVRAQAYLKQGNGAQAATEFKNILDHRGLVSAVAAFMLWRNLDTRGLRRKAATTPQPARPIRTFSNSGKMLTRRCLLSPKRARNTTS